MQGDENEHQLLSEAQHSSERLDDMNIQSPIIKSNHDGTKKHHQFSLHNRHAYQNFYESPKQEVPEHKKNNHSVPNHKAFRV